MADTAVVHRLNIIITLLVLILLALARPVVPAVAFSLVVFGFCVVLALEVLWTLAHDSVQR